MSDTPEEREERKARLAELAAEAEKKKSVSARVCAAKAEIGAVQKTGFNPHGKYKFASVDDVYHAVRPILAKHGLDLKLDIIECRIEASAKGTPWAHIKATVGFEGEAPASRFIAVPMTGPQTYESVSSYLQKQFLRARLQIETGEYDEQDMTTENPPAPAARRDPPKPAEPTFPASPALIPIPQTEDGQQPDWMAWGASLSAAIKASADVAEIDAWMEHNEPGLAGCEKRAPKIHERLLVIAGDRHKELSDLPAEVADGEPDDSVLAAG